MGRLLMTVVAVQCFHRDRDHVAAANALIKIKSCVALLASGHVRHRILIYRDNVSEWQRLPPDR